MSHEEDGATKNSRRDFTKLIAAAVAALPLVALDVAGQDKKRRSRSASKGRGRKRHGPLQEGSPITVGGGAGKKKLLDGSVNAKFSETVYPDPDPGGNPKKKIFKNALLAMRSLHVVVNGIDTNLNTLLPVKTITLTFNKGGDHEIVIYGKEMGIKIHTGKYTKQVPSSNEHKADAEVYIEKVAIDSELGWYERNFAPGEIWEVKTNTV